jgi:hypothetical protein
MTDHQPNYVTASQATPPRRRIPRMALLALGALLIAGAGFGTFASFSGSTSNSSTFATGTLVLSNKVGSATTCFSTGASTTTDVNDQACDALFTTTTAKPGDVATVNVTLKNEGNLDASALRAFATGTCANTQNLVATPYTGSGNLCHVLQLTIQEYSDAARTTVAGCRYGDASVTNTCDFGDASKTVDGPTPSFGFLYPNAGQALDMGGFTSAASRYFTIGVQMPSSADDTYQGRQAAFGIKWTIVQ